MHTIGIDVSKAKLHCSLLTNPGLRRSRNKAAANNPAGFSALLDWACRHGQCEAVELHFIMEATGVYHEALAEFLVEAGCRVSVANPFQVKRFAESHGFKTKNDRHDGLILALFGHERQLAAWTPPPPEVRHLKALLNRLAALETDIRRELNRLEKAQVGRAPAQVMDSLTKSLAFLNKEKDRLLKEINTHFGNHPKLREERDLLLSIPGVGDKLATQLLALFASKNFSKAPEVAAFLGLVPVEKQSGTSVLARPRLSKAGNSKLRKALYMPAIVATKCNPDVQALYERLIRAGKTKMAAVGAAMRKLVHIAFGVYKNHTPYQPQNP
ncbi:MAG: IS110 family transposase [Desulfobulbaceae bacterium]|jgi:transposase|nr:IS110 family transposase [Desulfobulbaceae bacterium]